MHHTAAPKVDESVLFEPSVVEPNPAAGDRVHDARQAEAVDEEGRQVETLSHRAAGDGRRRVGENGLIEPIRQSRRVHSDQGETRPTHEIVAFTVSQGVAQQPIGDRADN